MKIFVTLLITSFVYASLGICPMQISSAFLGTEGANMEMGDRGCPSGNCVSEEDRLVLQDVSFSSLGEIASNVPRAFPQTKVSNDTTSRKAPVMAGVGLFHSPPSLVGIVILKT